MLFAGYYIYSAVAVPIAYHRAFNDYVEKENGVNFMYEDSIRFEGSESLKRVQMISEKKFDSWSSEIALRQMIKQVAYDYKDVQSEYGQNGWEE